MSIEDIILKCKIDKDDKSRIIIMKENDYIRKTRYHYNEPKQITRYKCPLLDNHDIFTYLIFKEKGKKEFFLDYM